MFDRNGVGHPPHGFTLEVIEGRHSGASVVFGADGCSVGCDQGCDIMLSDANVASRHVVLRGEGGLLRVEAKDAFAFVGGRRLPSGHGLKTTIPADLQIGKAKLRISMTGKQSASGGVFRSAPKVASVAAVIVLAAASAFAFARVGTMRLGPTTSVSATGAVQPLAETSATKISDASEALTAELLRHGSLARLQVTVDRGLIKVSGALSPRQQTEWQSVQQWFDTRYGGHFVLANLVSSKAEEKPELTIQAVKLGPQPYAVTSGGHRIRPGDQIADGWLVTEITDNRIEMKRSGETFAFAF